MKRRIQEIGNYVFDASAKTITFTDVNVDLNLSNILSVINCTQNVIIYLVTDPLKGGTIVNNVLTLTYDTSSMSDTDDLLIYVDSVDLNEYYDSVTSYYTEQSIAERGEPTKINLRPKVSTEGLTSMDDIVYSLSSTDTVDGVLQIFRASADNIHDIYFAAKGEHTSQIETLLFDMEYSSDSAARADWVSSKPGDWSVKKDGNPVYSGNYCLKLEVKNSGAEGETVTHTFPTYQDWSSGISIDFRKYCNHKNGLQIIIEDSSGNEMSYNFNFPKENKWFLEDILFEDMIGYSGMNMTEIAKIMFKCLNGKNKPKYYIDQMNLVSMSFDTLSLPVEVELYDFGTVSNPTTLGTPITLDDGTTSVVQNITRQSKVYNVHLHKNSYDNSNPLIVGNYYGLYFKRPVDGKIHFLGDINSQSYISGKSCTVTTGNISAIPNKSLGFLVFASVPGLIKSLQIQGGNAPESHVYLYLTDANKKLRRLIASKKFVSLVDKEFVFSKEPPEQIYVDKNNILEMIYSDSFSSEIDKILVNVKFFYKFFPTFG